jgi:ADP-ribosylglycohydrolase
MIAPTDNRPVVSALVAAGRIRSAIDPGLLEHPASGHVDWNRASGMLYGLAIGDSLGNTSEGLVPAVRREHHGEIRDYLPNRHEDGSRVGLPSDDTQLTFWAIAQMLEDGGLIPEQLASRFVSGRIFGIGSTMRAFLRELGAWGDWLEASQESAGNGALMRIAAAVLPHLRAPSTALWADALLAGSLTHNDFASNACCVAFTRLLWDALHTAPPVPRGFWLERFEPFARAVEGETARYEPRAPAFSSQRVTLCGFTVEQVGKALREDLSVLEACERWYSGAYLLETMPSVLLILERHGNDPEEAIVRAVNDTRDNDTVAAIVGAAVGALHGEGALPKRWREGLLGRTREADDGEVQAIVAAARRRFG